MSADNPKNLFENLPLEFYKVIVENMTEGLWVGDKDHLTVYVNPAFERIFGYSRKDWFEKHSYTYFDDANTAIVQKHNRRRTRGEASHYEVDVLSRDGGSIPVLMSGAPTPDGGTVGIMTDLRSLKQLEKNDQAFQMFAQYSDDAMVSLNEKDTIHGWNVGAERMFGWKAEEVLGKSIEILIPESQKTAFAAQHLLKEANEKGFVRNYETVRLHKNGTPIEVSLTYTALRDKKGRNLGYSAVYRDITTHKRWERELQQRFERMHEAYGEMGKTRRYMDYLVDLVDLAIGLSPGELDQFIVTAVLMFSRVDAVILRRYDSEKDLLRLTARAGATVDWSSKASIPFTGSLAEKAFEIRRPFKSLDVTQEPRYRSSGLARKNHLRSLLLLPLFVGDQTLGSLSVYISPETSFDVLNHEFIPVFAKQASLCLLADMSKDKNLDED